MTTETSETLTVADLEAGYEQAQRDVLEAQREIQETTDHLGDAETTAKLLPGEVSGHAVAVRTAEALREHLRKARAKKEKSERIVEGVKSRLRLARQREAAERADVDRKADLEARRKRVVLLPQAADLLDQFLEVLGETHDAGQELKYLPPLIQMIAAEGEAAAHKLRDLAEGEQRALERESK